MLAIEHAATDTELRLPRWAHVPGVTPKPDSEPLSFAKRLVPRSFRAHVPVHHPTFRYGMALYEAGFFWEAHEVWEAVWMAAPLNGRDRLALRALIQIANAGLKHRMKQPRAVARLLGEALSALRELERRRRRGRRGLADSFDVARLRDDLSKFKSTKDGLDEPPFIGLENRFTS